MSALAVPTSTPRPDRPATRAIHGGLAPDPLTGAILTPIHQSTTFVQSSVDADSGYTYTRSGNPTVAALERNLGALEDAPPAACFATGMAALTALFLAELGRGGHVVVSDVVYGGTVRVLREVLGRFGVKATFVDLADPRALTTALRPSTRLVLVETPANPTLKLVDIAAIAAVTRAAGVPLAVDNTFLTPVLQRPFELGADYVLYSTTKFIEGHNATVGGAVLAREEERIERIRFVQNAVGFAQSPFESWLTLRGIKTLPYRIEQHSRHALRIARWLERHDAVERVHYPGLDSFPQAALARRQQAAGGGVLSFELAGGGRAARRLVERVELCRLAESLGSVETLITHPATMTHADVPPAHRAAIGLTDGLVRLSVGLEDPDDVIADLAQALGRIGSIDAKGGTHR
jgi:cystathionine beta-lyase/cystathionine gamma-synthase